MAFLRMMDKCQQALLERQTPRQTLSWVEDTQRQKLKCRAWVWKLLRQSPGTELISHRGRLYSRQENIPFEGKAIAAVPGHEL